MDCLEAMRRDAVTTSLGRESGENVVEVRQTSEKCSHYPLPKSKAEPRDLQTRPKSRGNFLLMLPAAANMPRPELSEEML
jgi:hypothetical protein